MEEANRKRITAKSWLTRATNKLRQLLDSGEFTQISLVAQIEEFEKRLERVQPSGQVSRLPKLELPKFSGEYTEWQTFWDKFRAVIDSNNSIPTVNKFTYLQSLLQGEAAATISGLSLTETNYSTAKTLLQTRFGRPERIIFSHIQHLLQTNLFLTSKESSLPAHLWRLHDEITSQVRSLENLGAGGESYGVILTALILHQLPNNIRLEWARVGEGKEGESYGVILTALILHQLPNNIRLEWARVGDGKEGESYGVILTALILHQLPNNIRLEWARVGEGKEGESYGVILTALILHQLPNNIRLEWARVGEGKEGDLGFLLKFLHEEIQRRERSQTFGVTAGAVGPTTTSPSEARSGSLGGQRSRPRQNMRKGQGSATALLSGSGSKRTPPMCLLSWRAFLRSVSRAKWSRFRGEKE
ncbi:hypothetical protein RRG08_027822 [Elysia crispata]|uniref:Uncharacterized protein n=1 Tax=Elysia crispata TaxID=231223 RepID=A0AAE1BCS9_9GAST|nr:hypothetical protein RRG08_027822 [Elysia crispata]